MNKHPAFPAYDHLPPALPFCPPPRWLDDRTARPRGTARIGAAMSEMLAALARLHKSCSVTLRVLFVYVTIQFIHFRLRCLSWQHAEYERRCDSIVKSLTAERAGLLVRARALGRMEKWAYVKYEELRPIVAAHRKEVDAHRKKA